MGGDQRLVRVGRNVLFGAALGFATQAPGGTAFLANPSGQVLLVEPCALRSQGGDPQGRFLKHPGRQPFPVLPGSRLRIPPGETLVLDYPDQPAGTLTAVLKVLEPDSPGPWLAAFGLTAGAAGSFGEIRACGHHFGILERAGDNLLVYRDPTLDSGLGSIP